MSEHTGQIKVYISCGVAYSMPPYLEQDECLIPSGMGNIEKAGESILSAVAMEYECPEADLYYEVYLNKDDTIPVKFSDNSPYAAKLIEA